MNWPVSRCVLLFPDDVNTVLSVRATLIAPLTVERVFVALRSRQVYLSLSDEMFCSQGYCPFSFAPTPGFSCSTEASTPICHSFKIIYYLSALSSVRCVVYGGPDARCSLGRYATALHTPSSHKMFIFNVF
jgi:hypothetical protein